MYASHSIGILHACKCVKAHMETNTNLEEKRNFPKDTKIYQLLTRNLVYLTVTQLDLLMSSEFLAKF